MLFHQIIVLALIQGVTEFLPVSSSGHLVLAPIVLCWEDQGLLMDVAVHVGSLFAVMLYFWRDLWFMVVGLGRLFKGRFDPGARVFLYVVVATVPVVIAGYLVNKHMGDAFRGIEVVAWATLGFGIVLWIADSVGMTIRKIEHLKYSDAIIIGLAQCLALIPGTSRSGITVSAARMLAMERADAARFSMLLSIPVIIAAGGLKGWELWEAGDMPLTVQAGWAAGLSFVSALVAIALFMAWIRRATFTPFVIYRIALGCVLLAIAYGWIGGAGCGT